MYFEILNIIFPIVPSTEYLLTARPNVTYPGYMETFVNFTFNTTARGIRQLIFFQIAYFINAFFNKDFFNSFFSYMYVTYKPKLVI